MRMKNVTMIQVLLMIVCLVAYQVASGQEDFVVLTKGDTLKGKVKYLNYGIEEKVQITTSDNKKNIFSILQTLSFSMNNEVYNPVRTVQGYTFMKLLKSGYLSLYAYQLPDQIKWDGRYLLKKDGAGLDVPNINFKKNMSRYLSDCPTGAEKVETKELKKSNLDEIVDQYNACIESRTTYQSSQLEQIKDQSLKLNYWIQLETSLNALNSFEGKANVLEMITEIKGKIQRGEKVPNFLTNGLQEALKNQDSSIKEILEKAMQQLQ